MSKVRFINVSEQDDGIRLNRWFLKYYPDLPMSGLQKLVRTKQVKVDNKKVTTSHRLTKGEEVRIPPIDLSPKTHNPAIFAKEQVEFVKSITLYKDEDIIVLNKPAGLAVQDGSKIDISVDKLLDVFATELGEKPKLVHRLDKDTSGVLLVAKGRKVAEKIYNCFADLKIGKTYIALVWGKMPEDKGEIVKNIEVLENTVVVSEFGKEAITKYEVLAVSEDGFSLVKLSPITGRKHQLRVHLESIGNPIFGDDKYYGREKRNSKKMDSFLHLHACALDLSEVYGKSLKIVANLPESFIKNIGNIGIRWRDINEKIF